MQSTCKLCRALAASHFPTAAERELSGSDTFTRDQDICDACLDQDYAQRPRLDVFGALSLIVGSLIALIAASAVVRRGFRPIASSGVLSFAALAAGGSVLMTFIVWLVLYLIMRIRRGSGDQDPQEKAADADRFYWLAVWASLTGRARYKRRMLKRAQALGLADHLRLSDRRLVDES